MRSPVDVEQLLLDLPELEATDIMDRPGHGPHRLEVLKFGQLNTDAWPINVSVSRRLYQPGDGRRIYLDFMPEETPGDSWSVRLTPDQARHAAAILVAAARAAEEVPGDE